MKRHFLTQSTQPNRPRRDSDFPFIMPFKHKCVDVAPDMQPKRPRRDADFPFIIPFKHKCVDVAPPPEPPRDPITRQQILDGLQLTQEQASAISAIPQGSQPWLDARKNRLTASNFGAAVGMNKYKSPNGLLKDMLWNTFKGNAATRWGSEHEDVARDAYIARIQSEIDEGSSPYTSIRVEETGLFVNPSRPWLGSSPDGVVHVTMREDGAKRRFLLEIKCPYGKKFYDPPVPVYYNCQVQGVMANMDLPYCDFVVWTPTGMQITRVEFDTQFWDTVLFPKLKSFYFDMYLQAFVDKTNGVLKHGEIKPTLLL
jgi:putative phage-type endonuclease